VIKIQHQRSLSTFLPTGLILLNLGTGTGGDLSGTDTAERIITAAVGIINGHGTDAVTTRRIAAEAGVNIAAVNYHFKSRENLIKQVLHMTLSHLFDDWNMILTEGELTLSERVYFLLDYMMEGISRFPGLTRSYMFDPAVSDYTREQFTKQLGKVIHSLAETEEMKLAIGQAVSSVLSTAVIPEVFTNLVGGDISSEVSRRAFILPMVNRIQGLSLEISLPFLNRMEAMREKAFKE